MKITKPHNKRMQSDQNVRYALILTAHRDNNGNFIYANEHETTVGDTEIMKDMLSSLNYKVLCIVSKKRMIWRHSNYYICIDQVLGLGDFVEVEIVNSNKNISIEDEKNNMMIFIREISASDIEKVEGGYPWLLMEQKNKNGVSGE